MQMLSSLTTKQAPTAFLPLIRAIGMKAVKQSKTETPLLSTSLSVMRISKLQKALQVTVHSL